MQSMHYVWADTLEACWNTLSSSVLCNALRFLQRDFFSTSVKVDTEIAYLVLFNGQKQAECTQWRQPANMASTGVLTVISKQNSCKIMQEQSSNNTLKTEDKHRAHTYLCSRKVAWISHTRTKDLKFFNSVQISDICTLPMLWASSRNLDACRG